MKAHNIIGVNILESPFYSLKIDNIIYIVCESIINYNIFDIIKVIKQTSFIKFFNNFRKLCE